jgi:Ca2+-binding RTX toxin-like protein
MQNATRRASFYVAALAAVLSCSAFAQSASGATISYAGGDLQRVTYMAAPGETNFLTVAQQGADYVFTDSGSVVITAAAGVNPCIVDPVSTNVARCNAAAIRRIAIDGGDGSDWIRMQVAPPDGTVLGGGPGHDIIEGGDGSDRLFGNSGADRLIGNAGDDIFDTGFGGYDPNSPACTFELPPFDPPLCQDETDGGPGLDTLTYANRPYPVYIDGRAQNQSQYSSNGIDDPKPECSSDLNGAYNPDCEVDQVAGFLRGEPMEKFVGTEFDDTMIGNKRDNFLVGGEGADVLCGELGNDTVDYSGRSADVSVTLDGALPTDPKLVTGGALGRQDCRGGDNASPPNPTPPGPNAPRDCVANDGEEGEGDCVGEDVERVLGGSGDDTLVGNSPDPLYLEASVIEPRGANVLRGGPGDDTLDGRFGPDVLFGGSGTDTVMYANRSEELSLTIDGSGNDGSDIDPDRGITGDLNPFNGKMDDIGPDVENIVGGAGDDDIDGSEAANTLIGGGGDDDIDGKGGQDTVTGGEGDDSIRGGAGNDRGLAGNNGNDVLAGDDGDDALNAGEGDDLLHGGNGADDLSGGEGTDTVDWADATSGVSVSLNGINDDGRENEHDNVSPGSGAPDIEGANGGLADDTLVLGAGDGFIAGGPGNDYLDGGPGRDSIEGNEGLDEVDYSGRTAALSVDAGSPGGDGEAGENDDVFGDVETIRGGAANDILVGAGTVSVLIGNGGNDQLFGASGDDQLFGGPGADGLDGGDANDTLDGGDDADNLFGGSAADTLVGGGGNDGLDGGAGRDSLSGGAGTDTASYSNRTKALNLSFDGNSNDGESGEGDVIKADTENTMAGSGADLVNSLNQVKNSVTCGRGTDQIAADTFDEIAADCEKIINKSPCKASTAGTQMSGSGVVTVRVSCTADASGSLQLRTAGKVKTSKKSKRAKRLSLGRKSFKLKRGQSAKLKVRIKGSGKRVIKRSKKGITAQATVTVRQSFGVRSLSLRKGDKLKIKAKR